MVKNRHMSKYLDIGVAFLSPPFPSHSVREVSRICNISPQTALTKLNYLKKQNVLGFNQVGRNKEFFLTDSLNAKQYIVLVEQLLSLEALSNAELKFLITDLLSCSRSVIVYGSFAKGTFHEESDIDIVVLDAKEDEVSTVVSRSPRRVQHEVLTLKQFSKLTNRPLFTEIVKNHLIFGDCYSVVDLFFKARGGYGG